MIIQKIALNTGWQIGGKIVSVVSGLAVIALLTRMLGQDGFGGFTTITAYLQFFGIIVDFGLTLIAVQMLSTPTFPEQKTFNNILTLKFVSSLFFFGVAIIIAWIIPYPLVVKIGITIASISFFINAVQQVFVGWYQKYLRIAKLAIAEIIGKIALLTGIIIVFILKGGLLAVMPVLIIASASYLFFTVYFVYNIYRPRLAFDWPIWREIIKRSWPIALGIIFNLIYLKADTIILSLTRSQAEVGIYGASFRVIEVLITLPMMLLGLLLPVLTKSWLMQRYDYWKKVYQKTFDLINAIVWPLALGGIIIAEPVIKLIAGADFAVSAEVLKILLLALIAIFLSTLFGHLIISINLQKKSVWAYGLTAGIALLWYIIYIPKLSFWGAAIITLCAEIAIMVFTFILVGHFTRFWPKLKFAMVTIIASLVMYFILTKLPIHFIGHIVIGAAIYIGALSVLLQKSPKAIVLHFKF